MARDRATTFSSASPRRTPRLGSSLRSKSATTSRPHDRHLAVVHNRHAATVSLHASHSCRSATRAAGSSGQSDAVEGWRRIGAYVLCRDDDERVLLTRFRWPEHPDDGTWTAPGGSMEW